MLDIDTIVNNKKIKLSLLNKVLIVIFLLLILFSCVYKIKTYDNYYAQIVERNDKYVIRIVTQNSISKFIKNDSILVDNKKYQYEIINVEKDCNNTICYMVIDIKTNLDSKYLTNNIVNIKQITKDSVFNVILKRIKKGMNL